MLGSEAFAKMIKTVHRLVESRKVIVMMLTTLSALITETIPTLVQWMQLFGLDQARQTALETKCHFIAGGLATVGMWLSRLIALEDAALKAGLPPPTATATAVVQQEPAPAAAPTIVRPSS